MYYIKLIATSTRIAPILTFLSFVWYMVIWGCILGYIFIHAIVFAMTLRINKISSKFYQINISFTRYFTSPLSIFLLIPIAEIMLMMLRCENGTVAGFTDSIKCWEGLHLLYAFLSVLFSGLFYLLIIVLTIFYFYPFNSKKTSTKIDTTADTFLYIFKMLAVIKYTSINSDWISIVLMGIGSLLNLKRAYENPTYNNYLLESIISIRNASIFWTYLVILIAKVLETTTFNGSIYLLIVGYPLIITFSIIYYKKKSQNFIITNSNFTDVNEILIKLKYFKLLIESFLSKNKNSKSVKSNSLKKNEILLKGYISIHEENCHIEECPLKKFIENPNNTNVQKMTLLHYMNILFNEAIKKFPNSKLIIMNFVQFNYEKKYNLNAARTYLTKLEKSQNTLTEDFMIYCIKQNISSMNNNKLNRTMTNDEEIMRVEDTTEQKFKRLRLLIETATKLYGEFWGALSANLTNNLNLKKLFFIGNKLNQILTEINTLWENELKMKKIDIENQSVVQLYAYFLREILKNKKKSDEISKKLNEEHHFEHKKTEGDKIDLENLDLLLETQDLVIYSRTNEKGECEMIQCSNSIIGLLGFTKQEIIGKKIESLMPSIYVADHYKNLTTKIKSLRLSYHNHKDIFLNTEKRQIFILPKTKSGYLVPISSRFNIFNDDDFSNTYIIKSRFEIKDTKSVYAFYILTRDDFTIDSISSSCINLGLTMDFLKRYMVSINYLIKSENSEEMKWDKISEEEDPKKVLWVSPEYLYAGGIDFGKKSDEEKESITSRSPKKELNLLVNKIAFNDGKIIGFSFRLTNTDQKRRNQENTDIQRINFNMNRQLVYDMSRLNYIRTNLVESKTKPEQVIFKTQDPSSKKFTTQRTSVSQSPMKEHVEKRPIDKNTSIASEDGEDRKIPEISITKSKIVELQGKNSEDIKTFIGTLVNYGESVDLKKYHFDLINAYEEVTLTKVPLIKQNIDEFAKKVESKKNSSLKNERKESSSDVPTTHEFVADTTSSLNNIFNEKSITNIKYFSASIFALITGIIVIEFIFSMGIITKSNARIFYANKAFSIMNSMLYTKFFLTEALLAQNANYTGIDANTTETYILNMMDEMSDYHQSITDTYAYFSNSTISFSDEYNNFQTDTRLRIFTLSNGVPNYDYIPFSSAISRLTTVIFDISNVNNDPSSIVMTDRNAYELMMNILNDYLLSWRELTKILVTDIKNNTVTDNRLTIIFGISFLISVIAILGIKRLINKFIDDREKPVDLFLTIKKQKFEELKASSEAFLNKLLNKFFGNEEAEEEMLADSGLKMTSEDINISRCKS
jgi:hypothetical protein